VQVIVKGLLVIVVRYVESKISAVHVYKLGQRLIDFVIDILSAAAVLRVDEITNVKGIRMMGPLLLEGNSQNHFANSVFRKYFDNGIPGNSTIP
jgi:hypothetical protein